MMIRRPVQKEERMDEIVAIEQIESRFAPDWVLM